MQALQIYAGARARKEIQEKGFTPQLFSAFLGASGGPKWFVLSGLDKVIFSEFLDNSDQHIDIVGSSVGSFRGACFAQNNPKAAIERLAESYSQTVYSDKPSVQEITGKGKALLSYMLPDDGIREILQHPRKSLHVVVARCHGIVSSENPLLQGAGLLQAALRNWRGRQHLSKSFTRAILHSGQGALNFAEHIPINTEYAALSQTNIHSALMASGSIPMVIEGMKDISGLKAGMFRDGGIIDYHFDIQIKTKGLVLYPHFYSSPTPGWFDKNLKRQCNSESYDNVVLLAPSKDFIDSLPYGKITDRKDFKVLDSGRRIKYWQRVINESDRLAESFFQQINSADVSKFVQAINLAR